MLNARSIEQVGAARLSDRLARPLYEGYAFAQIPATVERLLTGAPGGLPDEALQGMPARPHAVLIVLVDAFGWAFVERHAEHPMLRRFAERGTVSKLSSQFPSTTAAHITTLHTGMPVSATGIYEWFMYEPSIGELIAPLLFSPAGDSGPGHLLESGVNPVAVFPWQTTAQRLAAAGVRAHVVQPSHITGSAYGSAVLRGAEQHGYHRLEEAFAICTKLLRSEQPSYVLAYFPEFDAVAHEHGPLSMRADLQARAHLAALHEALPALTAASAGDTVLILTADHGQVTIDPAETLYVNLLVAELDGMLALSAAGKPLAPAGSARDLFLHVQPDRVAEAVTRLQHMLGDRAEVRLTDALLNDGVFGPPPDEALRARVGNVVILPGAGESVWWYEAGRFIQRFRGHHGGLEPDELHVPFAALTLGPSGSPA
jgi:hypothetical protein